MKVFDTTPRSENIKLAKVGESGPPWSLSVSAPSFAFPDGTNLAPPHKVDKGDAFASAPRTRISVSRQAHAALARDGLTLGNDGVIRGPSGEIDLRGNGKPNEDVAVDVGARGGFTIRAREAGERGLGDITPFSARDLGGLDTDVGKSSFQNGSLPGRGEIALVHGHTRIGGVDMWTAQGTKLSADTAVLERLAGCGYKIVDDHRLLAPNGDEIDLLGSKKRNQLVELTMAGDEVLLRVRENNFAPWQSHQFALNGGLT